jgi:rRNA maturation protein Rpf1
MWDLQEVIPNSIRFNRGKTSLRELGEVASANGSKYVLLIGSQRGSPDCFEFYKILGKGIKKIPPTLKLAAVQLRRDIRDERKRRDDFSVRSTIIVKPRNMEHLKLVNALAEIFGMHIVSSPRTNNHQLYTTIDGNGKVIRIKFLSAKDGLEVGPVISIQDVGWGAV